MYGHDLHSGQMKRLGTRGFETGYIGHIRKNKVYLEVAPLVQGLGGSEYGHFPFSEIVLDQLHAETLDGLLLQTFVLVSQGSVGARRQILIVSHK